MLAEEAPFDPFEHEELPPALKSGGSRPPPAAEPRRSEAVAPAADNGQGEAPRQLLLNRDAAVLDFGPQQLDRFEHQVIERRGPELGGRRPDGLKELRDDVVQPADLAFADLEVTLQLQRGVAHVAADGFDARLLAGAAGGLGRRGRRGLELSHLALHEL